MRSLAVLPLLLVPVLPGSSPVVDRPPLAVVRAAEPVVAPRADLSLALEILHEWDVRRARAWASGDATALRSLYVAGSTAGRSDVRLLRAYTARGIVVRRMVTQVFAVTVLHRSATSRRLSVFDRVAGGGVLQSGRVARLPSSRPVVRTVSLRLVDGEWRVASVSDSGRGPRAARR